MHQQQVRHTIIHKHSYRHWQTHTFHSLAYEWRTGITRLIIKCINRECNCIHHICHFHNLQIYRSFWFLVSPDVININSNKAIAGSFFVKISRWIDIYFLLKDVQWIGIWLGLEYWKLYCFSTWQIWKLLTNKIQLLVKVCSLILDKTSFLGDLTLRNNWVKKKTETKRIWNPPVIYFLKVQFKLVWVENTSCCMIKF